MTTAAPLGPVLEHPGTALAAAVVGVGLALAYLAAEYLILPAWRFRAAKRRGSASVAALIGREARRVERLRDAAAILGEHAHPDAAALRDEAGIRAAVLAVVLRRVRSP